MKNIFSPDNRFYRIWYLRKLYFKILKNQIFKIGIKKSIITQFPFTFKDENAPPSLTIEFTNLCNLKCTYCTSPLKERCQGLMKQDTFYRIVNEVKRLGIPRVRIVGNGEPTIHPHFGEFIAALKKVTPVVTLTSNGNFINDTIAESIIGSGIDQLNISVDGHTATRYEKSRLGGNFDKLVDSMQKLGALRDKMHSKLLINIRVMVGPEDLKDIREIIAFWEPFGDVVSRQYVLNANGIADETFKTNEQVNRYPKCSLPFKTLDIHWNGDVPLCSFSEVQTKPKGNLILGNVNDKILLDIWHHPIIVQYRNAHRKRNNEGMPICNGCKGT